MYQLVRAIFKNPDDKTKVTLVYGNRNEDVRTRKDMPFVDLHHITLVADAYTPCYRKFFSRRNYRT